MTASDANAHLRADLLTQAARTSRREQILSGDVFPDIDDLRSGLPFFKGDMRLDIKTFLQSTLLDRSHNSAVRDALQLAFDNPTCDTIRHASSLIDVESELKTRLDLYSAYLGDEAARDRTVRCAVEHVGLQDRTAAVHTLALGFGLAFMSPRLKAPTAITTALVDEFGERGGRIMQRVADLYARAAAVEGVDADAALEDEMAAASKPKAAIQIEDGIPEAYHGGPPPEPERVEPGAIVVPPSPKTATTSHGREIWKSWAGIAGERLPIAQVKDLAASARRLVDAFPWAEEPLMTVLSDLEAGGDVVFRHTCLLGEPGTGKSAVVNAIATEFGLPYDEFSLAGMADSSAMGTSSRFGTAEECAPLLLIKREKLASVCMLWDELEKTSESRHNGSALDVLLPFLSPHQAKRLRDPCLNVPVDLSYVSHFATVNSLSGVPGPLRDRMRIIRMPSPGWQHLGVITERVLDGIAKRHRRNRGFYPPLAQDEMDLIKDKWAGGSLRRVERYVEQIVAGRDKHQQFGRA
jgi:hypothetical protein